MRVLAVRVLAVAVLLAGPAALAACGSSASRNTTASSSDLQGDAGGGVGNGTASPTARSTTSAYGFNGSSNGNANGSTTPNSAIATTVPGPRPPNVVVTGSALAHTVADELAMQGRVDVTSVSATAASGVVIGTTLAPSDTSAGTQVCNDALNVAGSSAITVTASTGARIAARAPGGACA